MSKWKPDQIMDYITIAIAILVVIVAAILYTKNVSYTYWKRKGVPYIEPEFYYGNMKNAIRGETSVAEEFRRYYNELKNRGEKHGGLYNLLTPIYLPIDADLLKRILQTDFDHFVNRGTYMNEKDDPLSAHLFNLEGERWKYLRSKLTPTFTSDTSILGKMKMMFQTLVTCSDGLEEILREHSKLQDAVDIKDVLGRFTTDIIGSCAFGIECNSLRDPNSEFRNIGRETVTPTLSKLMLGFLLLIFPKKILQLVGMKSHSNKVISFFRKIVKETIDYREKNNVFRKDFMHLLLQLKNSGKVNDEDNEIQEIGSGGSSLTVNEIMAQCYVFFLAGFETSSTTMTFALYELALHQDIQNKLREEIRAVLKKHDNKITYESVMDMPYLEKVINETLRKHPPGQAIPRVCNKDYPVPGTNVVIERGTQVVIPILALHRDPEYYPDPEVFDPERFTEENKAKRPASTFIPFGDGPRICIGLRFGMLQSKVGLVRILGNYQVTINNKTKLPIKIHPRAFIRTVEGDIWLNVTKCDRDKKSG
ncbi:hypothetical protein NQ317_017712 [Molorchus minor]|uniref:Cytochrome P450 n=1 Tax=Molorchus minor TaxID=1323400 RepID=A0ABQ9JGA1_9CUCU|nr:hypothetical protein NQ317_017712 [Molorchus minor]